MTAAPIRDLAEVLADSLSVDHPERKRIGRDLEEFSGLLTAVDWSHTEPYMAETVTGLRHLGAALSNGGADPGLDPLRDAASACVGRARWTHHYAPSGWSETFIDDFAVGELVGPRGPVVFRDLFLGMLLIGPNVTYHEHAHDADEIYLLLSGNGYWIQGSIEASRWMMAGDLAYVPANQRHEIRTGHAPVLMVQALKGDPSAPVYVRKDGAWGSGEILFPATAGGMARWHRTEPDPVLSDR